MKTNENTSKQQTSNTGGSEKSLLTELFENELKGMYWSENALTEALPKMIDSAASPELKEALQNHLTETKEHVIKVEKVFEILGQSPQTEECEAMAGLLKAGEKVMSNTSEGPQRDAGIIAAGQKVEHYEIASYGTLSAFAETLGLDDAVEILDEILEQEKNADETLSNVAASTFNIEAAR